MPALTRSAIPTIRRRVANTSPVQPAGAYVLYWMTAFRRLGWNFALDRAVELAADTRLPLVILEPLRCDYPWATARSHRFILDGMAEHASRLRNTPVTYYPYLEPAPGAGKGLLERLARDAAVVVGDDWPGFFHPPMLAAAERIPTRLELVDSGGLLPVQLADRAYPTAYSFRRFLQRVIAPHLSTLPTATPLAGLPPTQRAPLPADTLARWAPASEGLPTGAMPPSLPIDWSVPPVEGQRGGSQAAGVALDRFVEARLPRYLLERNDPGVEVTSGLSPYLHYGHVSTHQILHRLAGVEGWTPARLGTRVTGKRQGWWGFGASAEAFLEELITWRELSLNGARHLPDYDRYESLPAWARRTLEEHAADRRETTYDLSQLEKAETHDEVWNAAQRQLILEGRIAGYLRMLWGKKVLEWSDAPEAALERLIHLNNRYALDGRDPNSYSGIFWCFGRYDRAWAPERPVFGKVRYMSSASTKRKFRLKPYLARYGPAAVGSEN